MSGQGIRDNIVRLEDWAWRRPNRRRTRFQQALAILEPAQKEAVLGLMDVFGSLARDVWARIDGDWDQRRETEAFLPAEGTPLDEFGDDALISLTLEAGYTLGNADTFKAVLPYFLAGAFARPLESWVIDPDLLKAKLETLAFGDWSPEERRQVARALAIYAQHELDMADAVPGGEDEVLVATKAWAEHAFAAAL